MAHRGDYSAEVDRLLVVSGDQRIYAYDRYGDNWLVGTVSGSPATYTTGGASIQFLRAIPSDGSGGGFGTLWVGLAGGSTYLRLLDLTDLSLVASYNLSPYANLYGFTYDAVNQKVYAVSNPGSSSAALIRIDVATMSVEAALSIPYALGVCLKIDTSLHKIFVSTYNTSSLSSNNLYDVALDLSGATAFSLSVGQALSSPVYSPNFDKVFAISLVGGSSTLYRWPPGTSLSGGPEEAFGVPIQSGSDWMLLDDVNGRLIAGGNGSVVFGVDGRWGAMTWRQNTTNSKSSRSAWSPPTKSW